MDEAEKKELVRLFAESLAERERKCPLGISRENAMELIDFASSWRKARKTALAALIGALVTSIAASLLSGIRGLFGH